jgi:hypothetical protein
MAAALTPLLFWLFGEAVAELLSNLGGTGDLASALRLGVLLMGMGILLWLAVWR